MARHPQVQGLQAHVQQERILRRLDRAHIPHQLRRRLGDVSPLSEPLRIDHAVIGLIRLGQPRELVRVSRPVKIAAVYDAAAYAHGMAVHVLRRRMGHDVRPPLKRPAVDRRGERIVHDQRHAVTMSQAGKLLNIQHHQGRIGDRLAKYRLGVGTERLLQLLLRRVRVHQGTLHAKPLQRHGEQIGGASIDGGCADDVIPGGADVQYRVHIGRLSGGRQHRRRAAL